MQKNIKYNKITTFFSYNSKCKNNVMIQANAIFWRVQVSGERTRVPMSGICFFLVSEEFLVAHLDSTKNLNPPRLVMSCSNL